MANRTLEVFNSTASTYDADRARLIPGFDSLYRWAIAMVPDGARRILELGAGSGLMTMMLRERFPAAEIHLIDFSAPMLEIAGRRFAGDSRITLEQADYTLANYPAELDAVVSSLSIHHLSDENKRLVFEKAHGSLRTGGVFSNAEQVAGPTAEVEERYRATWLEQVRAAGATAEQIEASLFRMREDQCSPVEQQLGWMREAGFRDADCWFKEGRFAVLAGSRS